jgi:hypothetical protein
MTKDDLPPSFKYIEHKNMVVFNYKLYDHKSALWFYDDSRNYLFLSQNYDPLCVNGMELEYMNRMKIPFFINNSIDFRMNGNAVEATYQDENGNNQVMNAGKAIKNLPWLIKKTDSDIESMVNQVKAKLDPNLEFKIVSGSDILYWYHGTNYASNTGSLGSSCMRYGKCQPYLHIYRDNPVEMLIAIDSENKLHGRALLWPRKMWNRNYWDGVDYIMDRIYGKDHIIQKFKIYAQNKKWVYKNRQTFQENDTWRVPGDYELCVKRCRMNLDNINFDEYPYMDTFNRIDWDESCLKNHGQGCILDSTEGYINDNTYSCNNCGSDVEDDDSVWVNDERYCSDCTVYSEYSDCDFLENDATWCEHISSYIHYDDAVKITFGSYIDQYTHYDEIIEVYNNEHENLIVPESDVTSRYAPVPFYCEDPILRIDFKSRDENHDGGYLVASLHQRYTRNCWEQFMDRVYSHIRNKNASPEPNYHVIQIIIKTLNNEEIIIDINDNYSTEIHETMCAIAEHYPLTFESLTI